MNKEQLRRQQALEYHAKGRPGKIEVIPTKEAKTQRDLSLAYSPGVAEPCMEIFRNPEDVYKYTAKGNLVAVISNGTAVLGLGDIGPEAGKPVMEGKGVLFKIFADIDVFDIEINEKDPEKFVEIVKALEPTFGGINLEDIKAPECFYIEKRLKEEMKIPLMHDDQHGTAIISAAALINALELQKKKIDKVQIVVNGAGAAAISCIRLYVALGAKKENIKVFDSKGLIQDERTDLDDQKKEFVIKSKPMTLEEGMKNADVFIGLSKGNVVSKEMVKSMAKNPIVFAMANPDPEISYDDALDARKDVIMGTGRSDYPNQINNVLGFPYIFRGALDVRATKINEEMKLAAVKALAELTKTVVPDIVNMAYNEKNISFGPTYIIPKPLDPRLLSYVAPAVAKAAIESGVAQHVITDWEAYEDQLNKRLGIDNQLLRAIGSKARKDPRRVVFADAENVKVLKAAQMAFEEGVAYPILLGDVNNIKDMAEVNGIDLDGIPVLDPKSKDAETEAMRQKFGELFFQKRQRKGLNRYEAVKAMKERTHFGCMMVETGEADALISGLSRKYADTIRPALQIIGKDENAGKIAGMYIMLTKRGPLFLADATVNFNPKAEELADITQLVAKEVRAFGITPRVAMLSYSNFGSSDSPEARMVAKARDIVKQREPNLVCDGDIQPLVAFNKEILKENYPFSELVNGEPNVLIFPNLASSNIAYNLLQEVGDADAIGPILLGLKKSVHILQLGSSVRSIFNMVLISVIDAQMKGRTDVDEAIIKSPWWKRFRKVSHDM
ncbi:malate dehydrogenase (oxaloacetate-decarboxylating)(NADP+) [Lacibacter cauensis]|uniref:Malate dehydrogenase (Oxaloacetate-decarboxylating)(NADP+) n=1 Tax=Lacibacter cauensis TaxID=510947 RepID=A0A562SIH5_9BACT|nr:NADP-dependent malic enzyme [Lacibacter cauensis]TWI81089.1 malate dehydrogenase (oxaloacetate-decarboxylating)(NADP+) [Lacibacter cauensis]